ncbi:hypothetical protein BACSP_00822 [Bacillus sp. T2.9-1]|jgi:hypothetical protein|nr:hypothetical protein [Bacillus sp. T2.9-1]CAI9395021.1 hypothetical protein BACSP_00822 [Bacillus sp. T2.9-1]
MLGKWINSIIEKPLISAEDNLEYEHLLEMEFEDSDIEIINMV